jgi:hypothetical protein
VSPEDELPTAYWIVRQGDAAELQIPASIPLEATYRVVANAPACTFLIFAIPIKRAAEVIARVIIEQSLLMYISVAINAMSF